MRIDKIETLCIGEHEIQVVVSPDVSSWQLADSRTLGDVPGDTGPKKSQAKDRCSSAAPEEDTCPACGSHNNGQTTLPGGDAFYSCGCGHTWGLAFTGYSSSGFVKSAFESVQDEVSASLKRSIEEIARKAFGL